MGFFSEIKSHKFRTWKTICMSLVFVGLGLVNASVGPTMLDLQLMVRTTLEQITLIIPMKSAGQMFGAVICGLVLPYSDHQTILPLALILMTGFFLVSAFCTTMFQLLAAVTATGMFCGFVVNAGNVWIIYLWGKVNEPFMQLAHFSFGIGAFIAPIICEPFLFPLTELKKLQNELLREATENHAFDKVLASALTNMTFDTEADANLTSLNGGASLPSDLDFDMLVQPIVPLDRLRIHYAYSIIAIVNLVIFIVFSVTCLKKRSNKPHPTRLAEQANVAKVAQIVDLNEIQTIDASLECGKTLELPKETTKELKEKEANLQISANKAKREMTTFQKVVLVLLISLLSHLTYALELAFGQLLSSYCVKSDLHLEKSTGSFITSFYWGCFTFFRLVTIFTVNYMSSRTALYMDLALVMTGMAFLVPLGNSCEWALWVGAGFVGIGISSVYPSILGYLESIMPVTSRIASITTVFACIGEFIVPVVVGYYIEEYPMIFIHVNFLYACLACVMLVLAHLWERRIRNYIEA